MYKKKHIIITAVVTFYLSVILCIWIGVRILIPYFASSGDFRTKLSTVDAMVDEHFILDYDTEKMEEAALEGYVSAMGDRYSEYISKEEFPAYKSSIEGEYKGIGVVVSLNDEGIVVVNSVTEGGPAQKAGILSGDVIESVNGVPMNIDTYNDVLSIIRGTDQRGVDDTLSIVVVRDDIRKDFSVVREVITTINVTHKMLDGNVGYIRITSFEGKTAEQFNAAVDSLVNEGAKSMIFDVRGNPGGTLGAVVSTSDRILKEGRIITIRYKNGDEEVYDAEDDKSIDMPMCVLADRNSASASEVFASALKDHGVAKIIGENTFGKGIVQCVYELGDASALKLTVAKYYTPNNVCIHGTGVKPDIEVELDDDVANLSVGDIPQGKDAQLNRALEELRK